MREVIVEQVIYIVLKCSFGKWLAYCVSHNIINNKTYIKVTLQEL